MDAYLKDKATAKEKVWVWRPLRKKDELSLGWNLDGSVYYHKLCHGGYHPDLRECRPYHRAIPMRVLARVQEIEEAFKDRVHFFVTDYAAVNPDPFIAVTADDMRFLIFDMWDEPQFLDGK